MKKYSGLKDHEEQVHPGEEVSYIYKAEQETGREDPLYLYDCVLCDSTLAVDLTDPEEIELLERYYQEGKINKLPPNYRNVSGNKLLSGFRVDSELLDNPVRREFDSEDEHKSFVTDERGKNPFLEEAWEETKKIDPKQSALTVNELKDRLPPDVMENVIQFIKVGDDSSAAAQLQEWNIDQDTITAVLSGRINLEESLGVGEYLTMDNLSPGDLGITVTEIDQKISEMFQRYTHDEIWDIAAGRKFTSPEEMEIAKEIITRGLIASKKAQMGEVETINSGMEGITQDNKKVLVMDPLPGGGFKVHIDEEGTIELSEEELRSRVDQWFPGIYSRKRSYSEEEKVRIICANLHEDASIVGEREDHLWIVKTAKTSSLTVVYWDQIYLPLRSIRSIRSIKWGYKKEAYIKEVDGEYCVFSHQTDHNFGCYPTKSEADERLEQIKRFGSKKKAGTPVGAPWANDTILDAVMVYEGLLENQDLTPEEVYSKVFEGGYNIKEALPDHEEEHHIVEGYGWLGGRDKGGLEYRNYLHFFFLNLLKKNLPIPKMKFPEDVQWTIDEYADVIKDSYASLFENMGSLPSTEKEAAIDAFFDISGNEVRIGEKVFTPEGKEAEVTNINPLMGVSTLIEGDDEVKSFSPKQLLKK